VDAVSLPVPLGVRIYNVDSSYDQWITPWVDDLTFRSVIPGGFASATLTIRRPNQLDSRDVVTATGFASGTSATPDYIVVPDSQAAGFNVGARGWVYEAAAADLSVSDSFTRSVSNSWGTATSGQTWANSGGANSDYSVTGSVGRVAMNSVNVRRFTTISSGIANCVLSGTFKVSATATGGSISAACVLRYTDDNNFYMVQFLHDTAGTIDVEIVKRVAGTFTTLASLSNFIGYTAGSALSFKVYNAGTEIGVRVWSGSEPSGWQLVASDGSFSSGKVGTHSNLVTGNTNTLPVNVDYDDFSMANSDVTGAIRFGGARLAVKAKNSAFGFTNLVFDQSPGVTNTGDVFQVAEPMAFWDAGLTGFNRMVALFNKIQIVDLQTAEIAWEGRIEDPARASDVDTWELGCLGNMVAASDIKRPMFYIDSGVDSWIYEEDLAQVFGLSRDDSSKQIIISPQDDTYFGIYGDLFTWQRCEECDLFMGRFDITYAGSGTTANLSRFRTAVYVYDGGATNVQTNVDLTAWNAAKTRKANPVAGASSFTSTSAQRIAIDMDMSSSTAITRGQASGNIIKPSVQVQRVNRSGTHLTSSSDYPNEYVTVPQIVEDVVGRFLCGAFNTHFNPSDWGPEVIMQVRPNDAYIDTSSTRQIYHLTYFGGATAADILNDLIATAQSNAYWAIWESAYGAVDGSAGVTQMGARFEWGTWPASWGYQISSKDGLTEKPDGENLYNYVWYVYTADTDLRFVEQNWNLELSQELRRANMLRATTILRESATDDTTAFSDAGTWLSDNSRSTNSGSVTVARPILFYDAGLNSNEGAGRMLNPWMIRPGKLARVTDLPPSGQGHDFTHGTTSAPNRILDDTIFKVVATEYSTRDNTCKLDLDQVATWDVPAQITAPESTTITQA
jgi:hypothetical protein